MITEQDTCEHEPKTHLGHVSLFRENYDENGFACDDGGGILVENAFGNIESWPKCKKCNKFIRRSFRMIDGKNQRVWEAAA